METNKKTNATESFFKTLTLWIIAPVLMLRYNFPSDFIWETVMSVLAIIAFSMFANTIIGLFKNERTSPYFKPKLFVEIFQLVVFFAVMTFLWNKQTV